MQFIEHIIEPKKLLLTWQSADEVRRTRYVVGELQLTESGVTLTYVSNTKDFSEAQSRGFQAYPAFLDTNATHHNVLDAFMRRLPPRSRGDFVQYLEGLRLKPNSPLSDFALLGYSGARLPTDGFSVIHPFIEAEGPCELLLEATGFRQIHQDFNFLNIGDSVTFASEYNQEVQEEAIRINVNNTLIGYVTRALLPTFQAWLNEGRVQDARIEKINAIPGKPTVYVFVKISAKH